MERAVIRFQNLCFHEEIRKYSWALIKVITNKPLHKDNNLMMYTTSTASDQPAHLQKIIWVYTALQKHAYSNILKISPPENWKFSDKNSDIFHISAQNIDCGYSLELPHWGGSNK